jgi:hypothetical protein
MISAKQQKLRPVVANVHFEAVDGLRGTPLEGLHDPREGMEPVTAMVCFGLTIV